MKKKIILGLLLMLFFPFVLNAYEIEQSWQIGFGGNDMDKLEQVYQVDDEHFVAIGLTYSDNIDGIEYNSNSDAILLYYDIDGNILWKKTVSTSSYDYYLSALVDENKYIVVVGYSYYEDAFIFKYDLDGNLIWEDYWGGEDTDSFNNIYLLNDGYLIIGDTESKNIDGLEYNGSSVGRDVAIVKYDFSGNLIWQKRYGIERLYSDIFSSHVSSNGEIVMLGQVNGSNYYLTKFDRNGNVVWQNQINGLEDFVFGDLIYITDESDIFVVSGTRFNDDGEYYPNGLTDAVFMKFDKNGNKLFEKKYGGSSYDHFNKIMLAPDGNFLVMGQTDSNDIENINFKGSSDVIMVKYDREGNVLWEQSYGTADIDRLSFASYVKDDGFLFIPETVVLYEDGEGEYHRSTEDGIVQKYDKNGKLQWTKTYGGSDVDYFSGALLTKNDDLIVLCNSLSTDISGISNKGNYDSVLLNFKISYEINVFETMNGFVKSQIVNNLALINATPDEGYEVDKIVVTDTLGNVLETSKIDDLTYSVDLYDDVKVEVLFKEKLVNPKTGVSDYIGVMFTIFIIGICAFFMIRNCNNIYDL